MAHRQLPEMPSGPVLELHGQRKVFHIPNGLKMLLEECTREVLRFQPENIYEFLANMLEEKLLVRNFKEKTTSSDGSDTRRKSWLWRRWSWDGSSLLSEEDLIGFLQQFNISIEIAQQLARIIQSAYRGYLARKNVKGIKEERDTHRQRLWEEWHHSGDMFVHGRDVLEILAYYKISLFEANAFATKIQKVFRGHQYRKHLEEIDPELTAHLQSLGITKKMADTHASKIQSAFRGYMTRKNLKQMESDEIVSVAEELTNEFTEDEKEFDEEDGEGLEEDTFRNNLRDPENERPKYEAFFPEGLDPAEEKEIHDGQKLPPKFTHEHFGEIDPQGLREKFSTADFKGKLAMVMKGLEQATEERRKANLETRESTRKLKEASRQSPVRIDEEVRKLSEQTPKRTKPSVAAMKSFSAENRQGRGSSDADRKTSTGLETTLKVGAEESRKASTRAEESRKSSTAVEEARKSLTGNGETRKTSTEPEETRKLSTGLEEIRKTSTGAEENRKSSTGPAEIRKTSTGAEETQKSSNGLEENRKTSNGVEETRKTSKGADKTRNSSNGLEEIRKVSTADRDDRKISTRTEEARKTSTVETRKTSNEVEVTRKASTGVEESRKVSSGGEEGRKTSTGSEGILKLSDK